jgi:anion-transporting  ArsA/GET3 family ATPase
VHREGTGEIEDHHHGLYPYAGRGSQKQKPLEVLRDAAKRLFRVVVKKHPKLEKKLPRLPELKRDQEDAEKVMLHYLAELGETVEILLPDHEGFHLGEGMDRQGDRGR